MSSELEHKMYLMYTRIVSHKFFLQGRIARHYLPTFNVVAGKLTVDLILSILIKDCYRINHYC